MWWVLALLLKHAHACLPCTFAECKLIVAISVRRITVLIVNMVAHSHCCFPAQTLVFELFGVCGLLVQTVVLRYMLSWLGEARVLTVGLSAAMLEMLLVSFIGAKWQVRPAAGSSLQVCLLGTMGTTCPGGDLLPPSLCCWQCQRPPEMLTT